MLIVAHGKDHRKRLMEPWGCVWMAVGTVCSWGTNSILCLLMWDMAKCSGMPSTMRQLVVLTLLVVRNCLAKFALLLLYPLSCKLCWEELMYF